MRKIIAVFQVVILFAVILKVYSACEIMKSNLTISGFIWGIPAVLAEIKSPQNIVRKVRDTFEDPLIEERKLMNAIITRHREIENREEMVKTEIQRLEELKKVITAKTEKLKAMNMAYPEKHDYDVDTKYDIKKFKELARAYESASPDKVSSMIENIDAKTVATIILHMNQKKAGNLWGAIRPEKAVEITLAIINS